MVVEDRSALLALSPTVLSGGGVHGEWSSPALLPLQVGLDILADRAVSPQSHKALGSSGSGAYAFLSVLDS